MASSAPQGEWLLPSTFPSDKYHMLHMTSWCDGATLRATGEGFGPSPAMGGSGHYKHMLGFCKARAAVHTYADELWAFPPMVAYAIFGTMLLLLLLLGCSCCCAWRLCCRKSGGALV